MDVRAFPAEEYLGLELERIWLRVVCISRIEAIASDERHAIDLEICGAFDVANVSHNIALDNPRLILRHFVLRRLRSNRAKIQSSDNKPSVWDISESGI